MRRFIIFISIFFIGESIVWAQQRPHYSQYLNNAYLINPALAGLNDNIIIKSGYRQQWVGFEGAPKTFFVSAYTPLGKKDEAIAPKFSTSLYNHHGVGGYMFSDVTGFTKKLGAYASYAYHLALSRSFKVSMGLSLGLLQNSIDTEKITLGSGVDDPTIDKLRSNENRIIPDGSIGLWGYTDNFFVSFSLQQIFPDKTQIASFDEGSLSLENQRTHIFFLTGYKFEFGNPDITFVPSVLYKSVKATQGHFDVNFKLKYNNIGWIGLSYRDKDAIVGLIGMSLKNGFEVGYSYDITTSRIKHHSAGSHEIIVGFNLPKNKSKGICPQDYW